MKRPIDILRRIPKFGMFLVKKPLFGVSGLRNVALSKVRGRPMVSALEYAVLYNCQASCAKCSSQKMIDNSRSRLDSVELRRLGDGCHRLGVYEVNFTGGEPLIDKNLEKIISFFHPRQTFIGINTNGALLDSERIMSLREAGADLFKISLDSPIPKEHDELRGIPGLYEKVFAALRVIRETPGVRGHLCFTTTVSQVEAGNVGKALKLAKEHDATMGLVFPSSAGGWSANHEVLLEARHRKILDELAEDPDVFLHGNLGSEGFRCPCGTTEIYVTCYGDVTPCPFVQISFGNVKTDSIESIHHRMANWDALQKGKGMCHASEDKEFIKTYADPLHDADVLPMPYDKHPNIKL
jgi:MoaA/NifB/PqqE/SkfB family radical SAM enzyme